MTDYRPDQVTPGQLWYPSAIVADFFTAAEHPCLTPMRRRRPNTNQLRVTAHRAANEFRSLSAAER